MRRSRPIRTSAMSRNAHGYAAACRDDHDGLNLFHAFQAAGCPHDVAFAVVLQVARALIGVVGFQVPAPRLRRRDSRACQLRRVWLNVVLLLVAPDAVDSSNAGYGPDLGTDDPVLNRAQVGRPLQLGT